MANIIFIDNFDSFSYNLVDELKVLGNNVMVFRNDVSVATIERIDKDIKRKVDDIYEQSK